MATIHAEIPNNIDFEKAHETIDQIERDVLEKLDIFLVIHMDSIEMNDEMVVEKIELLANILKEVDSKVSFHDFRMVRGEYQINLFFDLTIPFTYTHEDEQNLLKQIVEELKKVNSRLNCIITLENSYVEEE